MALTLGSVSVASSGAVTKSGECGELYDLLVTQVNAQMAEYGQPALTDSADGQAAAKKGLASIANAVAGYVYACLTARASVKVATTSSALQRTPNPNNANTDTQGPSVDKFLAIV